MKDGTAITPKKRFVTILLLGLLTAIVPFSIDMYLPAFPDIAKALQVPVSKVALSLSSFFIGIGLGQLLYGPLLDRFGRKKPLYAGMLLCCITCIGCAYATSINALIVLRFVQAIGACAATIAATAMVRDFFPPEQNARIFSLLILVLSVSPMLAPTIGSFLSIGLGWQSVFIFLAVLVILIFLGVFFFLSESRKPDKAYSLNIVSISRNYISVLKEHYFIVYAILGGLSFSSLFSYIASSPGVFIEHFGLTQKQYGWLFALLASGLILASQVNTFLLRRFRSEQIIKAAFICQNCFGGILLLFSYFLADNMWVTIGLLFLYLSSIGLIMPNASALAMKPFEENAGSASALLGFIQMGLGSLATIGIGLMNIQTVFPMALCIVTSSLLGLAVVFVSAKFIKSSTVEKTLKEKVATI